jgi:serine/threonine-protein kinase
MPTVVFEVKDATGSDLSAVKVSMDGQPLAERLEGTAISIDPGVHSFTFETAGEPKVEKQFVIREGEKGRRERITFGGTETATKTPAAPLATPPQATTTAPQVTTTQTTTSQPASDSPPSGERPGLGPQKIAAIVAAGVGVVGVGIGTVFGLQAMSKRSDASNACPGQCADQNGIDLWKSAKTAGNVSTVAFIVGGVGLAAGATLWFTAKPSASTQVGIGPGSIELKGIW